MTQDIGLIIAVMGSAIAIIGALFALMFWIRQESNSLRNDSKDDRKDFLQIISEFKHITHEIHLENKDFHYRLLEIEKHRK